MKDVLIVTSALADGMECGCGEHDGRPLEGFEWAIQ